MLVKSCNEVELSFPEVMTLAKNSLFNQPILTGWGRTTTVSEIRSQLGTEVESGGDGLYFYSSQKLQTMYGLSAQDAELMAQFVMEYYIDK